MFRKPGRPPEDRLVRREEIWAAVGPLIEKHGARKLTMRQAAAAAFVSLGRLYYYFPDKRSLVLFGLDDEAHERACAEFNAHYANLKDSDPVAAAEALIHFLAARFTFVRPAMLAAVELGTGELEARLEEKMTSGLEGFIQKLRIALPDADERDLRAVARAVHRLRLTGALDKSMTKEELEEVLRAVIRGVPVGRAAAVTAG
jgi:AcrR family transcriptional regulator